MHYRVIIVDDHEVVRMGLRTLLEQQGRLTVVGEAETAAEAVEKAIELKPDVVLMDVRLPDASGIEACRRIKDVNKTINVVMLTSYSDEEAMFAAVVAGASAYMMKKVDAEELYRSVLSACMGQTVIDPAISNSIVERISRINSETGKKGIDLLSDREAEILKLIADGKTNQEIADKVCLSNKTVRNYVSSLLRKLDITSRTQAAIYFIEHDQHEDTAGPND